MKTERLGRPTRALADHQRTHRHCRRRTVRERDHCCPRCNLHRWLFRGRRSSAAAAAAAVDRVRRTTHCLASEMAGTVDAVWIRRSSHDAVGYDGAVSSRRVGDDDGGDDDDGGGVCACAHVWMSTRHCRIPTTLSRWARLSFASATKAVASWVPTKRDATVTRA